MLKNLPPQFWKIFPLVLAGLFITSGIGLIISGSIGYSKATSPDDVLGFSEAGLTTSSMLTIAIGVTDFFTGLFGLAVALLNRKWLHMIYSGFMVLMMMGNLFCFYAIVTVSADDFRKTSSVLKEMMIDMYGNNSRTDGQKFTELVDKLQSETPCCGFSGNENENIFLKTAWYIHINIQGNKIKVPDSCCRTHGDKCREADDILKGRVDGNVHSIDCLNELYKDFSREMFIVFIEVTLSTLLQVASGIYTVLLLMYGPTCPNE